MGIFVLAAGVCLLIATPATAAKGSEKEGANVKLKGGVDVSGRIVNSSKTCEANRTVRILSDPNRKQIGSAKSDSKGRFSASVLYSGSVFAVATKTKKCKKASSRVTLTGAADLSVSIAGSSSLEFAVTNTGPDPANSSPVWVDAKVQPTATLGTSAPIGLSATDKTFLSIPVGGSERFAFGGCGVQGTGDWTASINALFFYELGSGPGTSKSPFDPNKANNAATHRFTCP